MSFMANNAKDANRFIYKEKRAIFAIKSECTYLWQSPESDL